jgi:hypothetical protein
MGAACSGAGTEATVGRRKRSAIAGTRRPFAGRAITDHLLGGLANLTWWEGNDCHNADAWESEELLQAFVETRLGPGMAAVGITSQPAIALHPAHEVFLPQARTITAS